MNIGEIANAVARTSVSKLRGGGGSVKISSEPRCEHGSLARTCPLCEANAEIAALRTDINSEFNACMFRDRCRSMEAEIAALRADVERLRGHLQDSVRAETSGRQLTVREIDGWWEISIPITIQRITVIPHWPCEAEILSDYVPPGTPKWFVPNAMKLAERWRAAFGEGGAA